MKRNGIPSHSMKIPRKFCSEFRNRARKLSSFDADNINGKWRAMPNWCAKSGGILYWQNTKAHTSRHHQPNNSLIVYNSRLNFSFIHLDMNLIEYTLKSSYGIQFNVDIHACCIVSWFTVKFYFIHFAISFVTSISFYYFVALFHPLSFYPIINRAQYLHLHT